LQIPPKISKNVNLSNINLALPSEELYKYIEHIKKLFSKEHTIISTPLEILGTTLHFSSDTIKRDKFKTRQEKFADMLFIYDALKIKMKKAKIQRSIVEYYTKKYPAKFTPNMDYSTIKDYNEIATQYIDNTKYKELIAVIQ
jgi:hypothetical protein